MQKYTLNEIAEMTGFTTRKLRYDMRLGILEGEKENGAWTFTQEEFTDYISHPNVKPSLGSKRQCVVYDFLADTRKEESRLCLILDDTEDGCLEKIMALVNRLQKEDETLRLKGGWPPKNDSDSDPGTGR